MEESQCHIFEAHSDKQERAILSKKRILLLATGTQYGKTTVGALRMKQMNHTYTNKDDHFIITSPNYKTMTQSTILPYLKIMDGYGRYNKKDEMFEIYNGGKVFFRTETDPDSIVGITNVRHIWGDEAGKYRLYFWENMQARADFLGCGIDLTTSPYSRNWVYKELIKQTQGGKRDDVEFIQAPSWDNPYHFLADPQKRAEKKATMDPKRFAMLYGGEWGQMIGVVYNCYDELENDCEPFNLPTGTRYFGGVDWGYKPDPFVLKVRAVTPDGRHYSVSEFYKTGYTITDMIAVAKQKQQVYGVQTFYCDPSQPGYIEEFNRNGLPAVGADNDILRGVDLHYELIKSRRLKFFRGMNVYTKDEMEFYHWPEPEDLGPDDDSKKTKPVDQANHCMDTDRYITISTYRTGPKLVPKTPSEEKVEETQHKRIERLKKRSNSGQTENW